MTCARASRDPEAVSLSGGNLQKYVVGREILREPRLLVVSQPTWGVDAGAAAAIRQAIIDLAARGAAVLVMSQDLDELYEIIRPAGGDLRRAALGAAPDPARRPRRDRDADGGRRHERNRRMRLVLERRGERSIAIALISPLLAIALTLATGALLFALLGKPPLQALKIYFLEPLTDPWALQEIAVKATPLVLIAVGLVDVLPGECLEHRRRGPVPDRRDHRRLARGRNPRHRCRLLGAARDARPRRGGRGGLCADPGAVPGALRGERDPHQPDAGLRRRAAARLSGARAVARSEGLQFPDHGRVRRRRLDADPDRGQPAASRRDHRAPGRDRRHHRARPHAERFRDQAGRRRAARRALRRLQRQDARLS